MNIQNLPQLKNKNFLESQIRQFKQAKYIIDNIEEENFNKYNQIELLKKTYLLEKKKQNYSSKTGHLFFSGNINSNNPKVVKKIENILIKKKLILDRNPKLIYNNSNIFRDDLSSPLNEKYKNLISNIDYNKRCFKNLGNKDFDSIFNDLSDIDGETIKEEKVVKSKSLKVNKKINTKKNDIQINKKRNKKNPSRLFTISNNYYSNNNIFKNRIKNIKNSSYIGRNNDSRKRNINNNINSTIFKSNENTFINKSNQTNFTDYFNQSNIDKKYEKFVHLLKKQNDKNIKLLNDVKKQHTFNKDYLLISLVKLNSYKFKKYGYH